MEKTNQVREMLPPEAQTLYDDIVEARVLGASKHIKVIFKMVEIVNNFYDQPSEVLDITIRLCEFFKEKRGKSSYAIVNALDDFLSNLPDVSSNEFRKILNEHVEHSINKMQLDVDKCVENALRLSEHKEFKRILIYDYSSTVDKFLKKLDPNVEVVIPQSNSINGGVPFLKNGVLHKRCKFIFDCAIADELPQCDAVFIGAETFFINGDAFNTIGSDLVSIIAKEYKKPYYVLTPLIKVDSRSLYGSGKQLIKRNIKHKIAKEISEDIANKIDFECYECVRIKSEYIKAYITEYGVINPNELFSFIKEYKPIYINEENL